MSEFINLSTLDLSILSVFMKNPSDEIYGLEVLKLLNEGRHQYELPELQYGSFYPALKKLEKSQILESEWGGDSDTTKSGARRRYYKITRLGIRTFHANQDYLAWVQSPEQQLLPA